MKKILSIFDYVFILKPVNLFPVWAVFLAGHYLEGELHAAPVNPGDVVRQPVDNVLWVGLAVTLLVGALFVLHQVMDRQSRHRDSLPLIAPGRLTPKAAFIEAAVLLIAGLAVGFAFSLKIGLVLFALVLLAGYFYSFAPFRLKDKPIAALLITGVAALAIFCAGWFINGHMSREIFIYAVPYICALMSFHVYASLPEGDEKDYEEDEKTTFALRFGLPATVYVGLLFELASMVTAFVMQDELIFYPTFFSLPFYVWAAISVNKAEMVRAVKYPILMLALTMCFKWGIVHSGNAFVYFIIAVYVLSKLYYRLRFGVDYPTLAVDSQS